MIYKYLKNIPIKEIQAYCDFDTYISIIAQCNYNEIDNFADFCSSFDKIQSEYFNIIAANMVKKARKDTKSCRNVKF